MTSGAIVYREVNRDNQRWTQNVRQLVRSSDHSLEEDALITQRTSNFQ